MSQTYSYVSSSTASNKSSRDAGKKPPVFLANIQEEYLRAFDNYGPMSPFRLDNAPVPELWKKRIVKAHILECLVLQNMQTLKRAEIKLKATQYYSLTRSLESNFVSSAQFCRMVCHWKKECAEEILEEAQRRIKEEEHSETAQTTDGAEEDVENPSQLRGSRSKARMNSPRAQKKHFEHLIRKASQCGGSEEDVEVVKRDMFNACEVKVTKRFCKANISLHNENEELLPFNHMFNKDGRGRPTTLEEEREEYLAQELHGLINIATPVTKAIIQRMAQLHFRDQMYGMDADMKLTEEEMNHFDDAWFHRFCKRHGFTNELVRANDISRLESTTAEALREYFPRVARTAVAHNMAEWNEDFDVNKSEDVMIYWNKDALSRVITCDETSVVLASKRDFQKVLRPLKTFFVTTKAPRNKKRGNFRCSAMGARRGDGKAFAPMILTNAEPHGHGQVEILGTVEVEIGDGEFGKQQAIIKQVNEKGSFDAKSFIMWLEEIVLAAYKSDPPTKARPLYLIIDGVKSHFTDDVISFCEDKNILLTALPPYCTHVLQAEDIYHFGLFKKKFYEEITTKMATMEVVKRVNVKCGHVHPNAITADINERDPHFWVMLKAAWEPAFSEEAVKKGFEKQGLIKQVGERYGMTRRPLWDHFPHHERVAPSRVAPPLARADSQPEEAASSSQSAPQPARSISMTDIFCNKSYDLIELPKLGSNEFLECVPAMTKRAVDAAELLEAIQEFCNKTPEMDELLKLLSQLPLVRQVCHTHLQVLKGQSIVFNPKKKRKTSNRLSPHQVDEVTKDLDFFRSEDKEEKRGDQRRVAMNEEESEWLKSLINPDWNGRDENKKYNNREYCFTRNELIRIHRGAELLGHDRPWTVGVGANLEKLVASLKVRDEALWKVHNAGASVHKGRKKMADIEVVVVDDEVDDDVANTPPLRRSKRDRNDL